MHRRCEISALNLIIQVAKPYKLPINLELIRAQATTDTFYWSKSGRGEDPERYHILSNLRNNAYEILSLHRNEKISTDRLIPEQLHDILWLTEEEYLSIPVAKLQIPVDSLTVALEDIKYFHGVGEVDFDYINRYEPIPLREAIIALSDARSFSELLVYDNLIQLKRLAELLPYPEDDGVNKRAMMELVTYATGYVLENNKLLRQIDLMLEPAEQELSENREFQKLTNQYLRQKFGVTYNMKTRRVAPYDHCLDQNSDRTL